MNIRFALAVCILLSTFVSADYVSYIHVNIDTTGKVNVKETITPSDEGPQWESIRIPGDAQKLAVYDSLGPLTYSVAQNDSKGINLNLPRQPRKQEERYVEYATQQFTSKNEGVWKLEFSLPATAFRTIIKIGFPGNSTILNWTSYRFSVGPDILYIYPDSDEVNFTATYQFSGETQVPAPQPAQVWWPYVLGVIIVAFVAGTGFYLYSLRKRRPQHEPTGIKLSELEVTHDGAGTVVAVTQGEVSEEHADRELKESVYKMLEENECKVVDVLTRFDEDITQAQIYHTTGIPKASLSDIMNRLERRNIIERSKEGRVKWVKLKKWVYK